VLAFTYWRAPIIKSPLTGAVLLIRDFSPFSRRGSYLELLQSEAGRPVRFGVMGVLTFILNMGLLLVFGNIGFSALPAYAFALGLAVQFNFASSQIWVWHDRRVDGLLGRAMAERWATFHGCIAVSLVVNFAVFAAAQLVMPVLLAAIAGVGGSTLIKFLSLDRLAFKGPAPAPPADA